MAKKVQIQTEGEVGDKKKALETAMTAINKKFGTNAVMKLGGIGNLNIPCVSTGILPLDVALGIGGLPRGRIVEIYGPEASGKTTVTLYMIAEMQKLGGTAAFIDAEHALDPTYAKKLGVDVDELVIAQPDTGEQGLDIAEALIRSGAIDIIVIDSVAALVPKTEIDGEMGDAQVGLHARMMSKALRKLAALINKSETIAVFINQLREKVGVMFGSPETTTGGRALKFYASVRLDVRRTEAIKQGETIIGNRVKIKVVKNKVAPPFRVAEFDLIYGEGYSRCGGLLDVALEMGLVSKPPKSSYYTFDEKTTIRGRDSSVQYLNEHPELADELARKIHELLSKGVKPAEEVVEAHSAAEENGNPVVEDIFNEV